MTDKYITYKLDGRTFDVPESDAASIEKKYPSATIEMRMGERVFDVPVSDKSNILKKYPNVSYAFEMNDAKQEEEKPQPTFMQPEEETSSIADIINDPSLSRRERKKAIKEAKKNNEVSSFGETAVKSAGSALATTGKMAVDATNVGAKMGRRRAIANNPLTGLAATIEAITGKSVLDKDNPLNDVSANLGETAERLSKEADPTGGEMGFGELLKKGHIGLAMQKGLGSAIESAPIMLATKNPYTAGLYLVGMAASNYADESIANPDIPEWKRGVNAVGSAALEMAVEKLVDIPWKYFGNAGGEITDEIANEVIERVAEEGAQTIAKRIKRALGNTAKDAIGEGFEEVITSLGNDALGSALDAIDGNKDYGFKAQWNEFKEQNPDATVDDFANAKGKEYVESFLGGALSSIYMSGLGNVAKEAREARARKNFDNAYMYGSSLDYKDMYDTNDDVNVAIESAVSASVNQNGEETLTRGFIENLSAEEAFALSRSEEVKPELRNALGELAVQKAKQDGLTGKLDDRVASSISEMTDIIEQASDNGTITSGVYGDKVVFVKGGVVNADGTISLPNGQSGPVIVFDGNNKYTVDSSEISGAWSTSKDGYIQSAESSIRDLDAFRREEFTNTMGPRAKAKAVKQYLNTKILINTEEGVMTQVEVQAILPDGQVLVKGKKGDLGGQSERLFGPSAFYDAIARNEDGSPIFVEAISQQQTQTPVENTQTQQQQPVVPSEPQDFRESEQVILIDNKPTTVEVTNQDDAADRVTYTYIDETGARRTGSTTISGFAEAIKQAEAETAVEVSAETLSNEASQDAVGEFPAVPEGGVPTVPDMSSTPVSSTEVNAPIFPSSDVHNEIPLQKPKGRKDEEEENVELTAEDINWDALFEQDTEAYFAELQKQFGEGAADVINMEIAATQKELDKLEKNQGATRTERVKNIGKIAKLRLEKGILEDMANRLQRKNEPISETAEVTETEQVVTPEVAATESITEPIDNSAEIEIPEPRQIPLDKKNSEPINGVELAANELGKKQGIKLLWDSVQRHTGYGDGEKKKFFGLFRTKEKGGMDLETAGERLMEIDREYGFNFFDQNDPNAGMNAILEALGANSTVGDLRSYTARMRQAEAQEYENAAYKEAMERFYEERGESYDDYKAYNEQLRDELKSGYALSDEQLNEYNATLAEEYDRYDRERNATENEQGEDGPVRTTEDIGDLPLAEGEAHGGSEGSNQVLRETQTVQQGGDRHAEGGRPSVGVSAQDAGIPVHGTEEGESVSTLDEDMPDFTTEAPKAPVAPKPVDNPIAEAQKREESLIQQLSREEIPFKQRQDLAYNAGKAVADFFATREEYEAYEEVAADLGEFIEDFDRGVEASFANRNQYHIGEVITESEVSEEAIDLVNALIDSSLEGVVDVERASDEQTKEVLALGGIENQFSVETDKPIFISNAALAVQGIKMEKATPEQWLKMIKNAGGLKAGEDKWMGLSDWLKASDKKTLTKQEVLDYINANTIQIEEVNYAEVDYFAEDKKLIATINDEFLALRKEAEDAGEWIHDAGDIAYQQMVDKYGDDFSIAFGVDRGELYVSNREAASHITGVDLGSERAIDENRIGYTTEGLRNNKEIALVVPTIEPWNEEDDIHFGDAGEGRAVAWIRFGETEVTVQDETQQRLNEIYDRLDELEMKVSSSTGITQEEYEERSRLRKERDELQEIKPKTQRVLVIDEIQSKRHQEGRESGYKVSREKADAEMDKFMKRMHDKYNFSSSTPFAEVFNEEEMRELARLNMQQHRAIFGTTSVPDAPFDKNWHELAMKRMLRYAAENGYDVIAWTKGEQQADRYDIGSVVENILSSKHEDGSVLVGISMGGGYAINFNVESSGKIIDGNYAGNNLSDIVGKEIANKILTEDSVVLSGGDLRIGGEGMRGFYDKILPAFMNKYGKKWGVKVADITLPHVEESGRVMHSVPVTEAMKESVMEGQPMFFKTPNGIVYGWTDGKKIYLTKAGMNPNTKIHEYTHLWAKAMMHKNPKGWNSIKQLLKKTPVWNEVINDANYSDIHGNEDMVASEVISRISGTKNAAKLEQMAQKMIDEAKGTMRKAEARGLIQNIKDALNKFWSWVGKNLFEIENFNSIDEITDRVLWDLINKTDLGELSEGKSEFSKKSYGKEKPYGQKVRYTPAFLDDIYFRVLSKYHFGKDSSPYVYMDGYIMRLDVPDSEHLKYYRNVEKTDGFGVRFDIFVGNITEEEFNALIEDYERGIPRTKEALSELFEAYRKNRGSELSSDNVHIENIESDTSDGRLYGQASERKDERRTSVSRSNSYLRASEIDSDIFPISRINLLPKTSTSTKLDTEYFDAIEKGKKVRAENIIEDAANSAGYTEAVYHGTPSYGFTEFESKRKSGAIFTTTARNTAANYGGDGKYASVRKINKGIKEVKSAQDVLDNATSVLDQNWRLATHQEKSEVIARVEADAKKVSDKIQELKADFSNTPFELQEAIAWMENIIYDAAEGRENGNEGNSLSSMLIDGYKKFKESREFARQYIQEHYNELTPEQWSYWSYINGFEVGDVAIDAGYSMARAVSENDVATVDGKSFVFIEDLNEQTQKDKNVGTYKLYGNLGSNPLVIDAEKKVWFDLDFNGMKTTDSIAEWAKENGYTSVVFKNIYDYGDLSDVKVFFNPSQLKSADAITYDNDGNIIPPSERFNVDKNDIRYRKADSQNAAVDYLAGDARLAAIQNAVSEDAKKLNVSVTYKTRSEMPKGHQNDKGYYNPQTGEIVICTENATSIADAIQTILHEAVAHKGLRQLMGDKFNEFINRVYDALDAETKAKVDALAESKYDGNTAVAMEEYMASLAETENFAENSVWDKIKSAFENIINAILGRNDIKIGDNELRYILRASYNNMVNPRNMESIRGWAQDQMMREEYKINHVAPELLSRTGIDPTEVATQTASLVYDQVVSDSWQEFQRQFQDAMQPVRIAIDAIQQETGNVPIEDYENYILIQNQSSSRSRVEIDDFARRYYSPIIEQVNKIIDTILKSRGYDKNDRVKRSEVYKEVKTYLIAKHGLERNAYYQTRNTRKITAKTKAERIKSVREDHKDIVDKIKNDPTLSPSEKANLIRQEKKRRDTLINQIRSTDYELDVRDYSGLTALFGFRPEQYLDAEAEAERCVENFENAIATDELWAKIKSATDKTLRHSYESGLLSRQQYNDIKAMFQFYIPLRGFDESTAEDVYAYARFEGNRFNPAVQKAEGRTSLADDPIAIIMNMAESEIAQGNKNRAKQALYNYLLNRSDGLEKQNSLMQIESVWAIKTVDAFGNEVYVIASPDHAAGETLEEFEERMQVMAEAGLAKKSQKGHVDVGMRFQKPSNKDAHYVYLKVNGVEKAIYINGNPKAADAINGTYAPMPSKTMQAVKDVQRLVSSTFTNYSLEFTARNYFRDMIYSHINIGVRESDPAYRKKFRQNWRHNNMRAMLKMLTAYRAGEYDGRPLTADEAAFVEFMNNGGQTGYTLINSVETHKKELERAIERMQKGIVKGGVKDTTIFRYPLGGIELLNEASELVTRFAAFKTSRDMGRGINRSINDAKEVTVNFNTKGAQDGTGWMGVVARYLGAVKYFFNASVQGVQNLGAAFQKNKLKFGSVVGGTIGLGMMMPILQGALSELMGGDEDEYWNIPEYDRQNNLCFVIGKGKYVKLPLPIGFREMYGLGDLMMAGMLDKKFARSPLSVGMDVANKIATIVLPINPLEGSANGLSLIESGQDMLLPDFTQGMLQNRTNTDFKGVPIQKEYTYNENDPQWTKAFANNPAWLTGLSKWCYENIGIDGEGWDWSPEKMDNTLSNALGGIYSLLKKTGKTVSAIWNEDNRTLSNVPLVGVIVGSNIDEDQRFVNSTYWEMDEYYNKRLYKIKSTAANFGLTLDDVFARNPEGERAGEHQPAMNKIYNSDYFDFMQEWYLGHKGEDEVDENGEKILGLSQIKNKIKNLENKIKKNEDGVATPEQDEELVELNNLYEATRRDLVNDLLELD